MHPILRSIVTFLIAVAVVASLVALGTLMSESDLSMTERIEFFGGAFLQTGTGPVVALALSLAGIALGEIKGIRSVAYYIIGGLVVGFTTAWSVDLRPALENTTDIAPITLAKTMATIACGIGGLVYWFIAGRHAAKAD
jgi:hypothetical protein